MFLALVLKTTHHKTLTRLKRWRGAAVVPVEVRYSPQWKLLLSQPLGADRVMLWEALNPAGKMYGELMW